MRENNLSGEDRVIIGDVGVRRSRTVPQSLMPRLLQALLTTSLVTRFVDVMKQTPSGCRITRFAPHAPDIRIGALAAGGINIRA